LNSTLEQDKNLSSPMYLSVAIYKTKQIKILGPHEISILEKESEF
jgi:hypothetical protein